MYSFIHESIEGMLSAKMKNTEKIDSLKHLSNFKKSNAVKKLGTYPKCSRCHKRCTECITTDYMCSKNCKKRKLLKLPFQKKIEVKLRNVERNQETARIHRRVRKTNWQTST